MRRWLGHIRMIGILTVLAAGLVLTGCDSGGVNEDGGNNGSAETATISGQVTDQSGAGSSQGVTNGMKSTAAGIEGATVTAVNVHADGSTNTLKGEATTDADGSFTLEVEGESISDVVLVQAEESSANFSSSALVKLDGQSDVEAQPITAETKAEAAVYLEAEARDGDQEEEENPESGGVMLADVAMHVDAKTAADINAGSTAEADVAAAIRNAVRAEAQYMSSTDADVDAQALAEAKASAFAELQSNLAAAADASARADAEETFEATMANLLVEAGASAETQAKTRQSSTTVMTEFSASADVSSEAAVGLRKQAELLRAYATAKAVEAKFEAEGAAQSSIDALVDARNTLMADIRSASSVEAIADVKADYETTVEAQLESELDVDSTLRTTVEGSIEASVTALNEAVAAVSMKSSDAAQAVVDAYTTFYADAESAAESSLSSNAHAEAAATIIVLMSVN